MSSRERCPYLVRVEVADTNMRGNDSRLYAAGAPGLGASIEEALAMSAKSTPGALTTEGGQSNHGFDNYHIPSELLAPTPRKSPKEFESVTISKEEVRLESTPGEVDVDNREEGAPKERLRGGWQANEETGFYSHSPEELYTTNPYDDVRENELEQLHHQMYNDQMYQEPGMITQSPPMTEHRYVVKSRTGF